MWYCRGGGCVDGCGGGCGVESDSVGRCHGVGSIGDFKGRCSRGGDDSCYVESCGVDSTGGGNISIEGWWLWWL